ncbi:Hypothetical protein EUBREC_2846 [Agathobacter rectalis ATCC 33656]|uniref:Uncharacterized protein n=1 Tax=Agathobacter rectalis (strain ATCC 33656 / DSM 3377 / JCM 17463 / KCTC 5835 / VPI 0990) TaxID=515619 RepID=C4ZHT8_AGARV|nr:Hypothetical protein EUBREC_2846 [Agathobacter rectalis ATCC 33656]
MCSAGQADLRRMLTTKSRNNIHHLIDKNYRFRIKDALDIYTFLLYLECNKSALHFLIVKKITYFVYHSL